MFNIPFYTSNGELTNHNEFKDALLSRRDEFCCDENKAYGTAWSTVHTQNDLPIQYPYINDFLRQKTEMETQWHQTKDTPTHLVEDRDHAGEGQESWEDRVQKAWDDGSIQKVWEQQK